MMYDMLNCWIYFVYLIVSRVSESLAHCFCTFLFCYVVLKFMSYLSLKLTYIYKGATAWVI